MKYFWDMVLRSILTAAVAQSVRALAPQAVGWVLESQPRQS